ncbi:MAG: hypothetical protein IPH44_13835 [Myxococcales bacterium]|nr:hypothetical protein [Myxococcales bacterium]
MLLVAGAPAEGPLVVAGAPATPRRQVVLRALDDAFGLTPAEGGQQRSMSRIRIAIAIA